MDREAGSSLHVAIFTCQPLSPGCQQLSACQAGIFGAHKYPLATFGLTLPPGTPRPQTQPGHLPGLHKCWFGGEGGQQPHWSLGAAQHSAFRQAVPGRREPQQVRGSRTGESS